MKMGNMVFVGLVISQAFTDAFNLEIAVLGIVGLTGAYLFAGRLQEGGGQ